MVKVKICGLTNLEDAKAALQFGADYLGFIFYPKSPRYIPPDRAFEIIEELPTGVKRVAVVVNAEYNLLKRLLDKGFDLIQLHGDETTEILKKIPASQVIKVFRVGGSFNKELLKGWEKVYALLLDTYKKGTYGGTGETFNWNIARKLVEEGFKIFLSGGLKPSNVERAVCEVKPYAVDVSSGVEASPGKKDLEKLRSFLFKAKNPNCGSF